MQGCIGHGHNVRRFLAQARHGGVPGPACQRGQGAHLLFRGVGGSVKFRHTGQHIRHVLGQQCGITQHSQLLQPCAAIQRAGTDAGQGRGQGQLRDTGAAAERARADGRQRFRQRDFRDVHTVAEGLVADGGDGREHLHIGHAAVGKGFRTDGGEPAAVVGIEGTNGLIALEKAVAQGSDIDVAIGSPDGQIGLIAVIGRPYAVLDGGHVKRVGRSGRHAAADGIVDPHGAVRALLRQHGCVSIAVPEAAVPGQIQIGHLRIGKGIGGNVDGLIQVEGHVIQEGARKGPGADALHVSAQVQLLAPGALKGIIADDANRGGQAEDRCLRVTEGPRADLLQTLAPVDPAGLGIHEAVVADHPQGCGKAEVIHVAGLLEGSFLNALQALGQDQCVDGIIAAEGILADGLHRHAADAGGNLQPGMEFDVAVNRPGGRVEVEPVFIVLRRAGHGVLPAGLQPTGSVINIRQRGGVGIKLIVGDIDHAVLRQQVEAPVLRQKEGAFAFEADLPQIVAGAEGGVHRADAGGHGNAGQRRAVAEVAVADVLQPVIEAHLRQTAHVADGRILQRAQGVRHGQRGHVVPAVKGSAADGGYLAAVHLSRDDHVTGKIAADIEA